MVADSLEIDFCATSRNTNAARVLVPLGHRSVLAGLWDSRPGPSRIDFDLRRQREMDLYGMAAMPTIGLCSALPPIEP